MALNIRERAAIALRRLLDRLDPGSDQVVAAVMKTEGEVGAAVVEGSGTEVQEMFSVVCASCGKETRSPIRPVDNESSYCLDCILKGKAPAGR